MIIISVFIDLRFVIIFLLFVQLTNSAIAQKSLNAIRIDKQIKVDGILDESYWSVADKATDFIQRSPEPGGRPSQVTEVAVLYNDAYIYIGAWLFDDRPDGILTELTSRDHGGNSDRFSVYLDTYNDDLNAYEFSVSAAGVQSDARISPGSFDRNWDVGWYSDVSITDEGWFVEIEIPLSALRFPDTEVQDWGTNFSRVIRRDNESVYWDEINPKVSGFVNQFGNMSGIKKIKTPLRLSITPYVSTYINRHTNPDANLSRTFTNVRGGLDIQYGINDAFTLNMMLIPDFGQVISDNNVLNLGPYEVYNEERRQFFTEGTELFDKAGIFYSRRIGGRPLGFNDVEGQMNTGEEIVRNPIESRILNATKITGRTKSGLGIGFLNAITNRTYATVKDSEGNEREIQTAPLVNYNVIVLDQSLKNNSFVSFTNSNVTREGNYYDANVSATNFKVADKSNTYAVGGTAVLSHRYGFIEEGDDTGFNTNFWLGKTSGNFLYRLRHRLESDNYNPNDLGFIRSPNDHSTSVNFEYVEYDPFAKFLNFNAEVSVNYHRLYNPNVFTGINIESSVRATFTNFLTTRIWYEFSPLERKDFDDTRTYGRFIYEPTYHSTGISLYTDSRKRFRISGWAYYALTSEDQRNSMSVSLAPRVRINDRLSLSTSITGRNNNNSVGYVYSDEDEINFGIRDIRTITNVFTTKFSFTKDMDIYFRMRHYWSSAQYNEFWKLEEDGRLGPTDYNASHDVNYNAFNVDMVYRWIFSPASEFSIVWKSSALNNSDIVDYNYPNNFINTFDAPRDNSISFKVLYYLDYLMLTRLKKSRI